MRASSLGLVDSVLRPARPHLERCLAERERVDQKRWRGSDAAHRVDAAVMLAVDASGVTLEIPQLVS